jgi:hypothetical protein
MEKIKEIQHFFCTEAHVERKTCTLLCGKCGEMQFQYAGYVKTSTSKQAECIKKVREINKTSFLVCENNNKKMNISRRRVTTTTHYCANQTIHNLCQFLRQTCKQ